VLAVFLIGAISINRFNSWYNSSLRPVSASAEEVSFTVEIGETPEEISKNLESAGLINSARAFSLYLSRTGQRTSLQAGVYRLNPAMSSNDIAKILINGSVDTYLLTIIPGLRLDQIQQKLIESGFSEEQVKKALMANYRHPLLASKPKEASLEGYIFPESIQVDPKTSVEDIIEQSFELFWGEITDDMKKGIEAQGLDLHEAITLASIIQMESADKEDQVKMARVFLNRLAQDMPLGSDPTFRYAAAIAGVEATVDIDSPYNTRIYKGLPPGPIANFTISALESVAFPADGSWLYFVSGDDGITRFSNTLEEHEELTERYCIELCQL
jgi:UPF0755 protein